MVQLKSYYSLCGLTERGALLGVQECDDDQRRGTGLVTLAKNVLALYRFSDQKQLKGWTTVDHLTAPAVYDAEMKSFVGVFKENTIKVWEENVTNLEGLKKYKFTKRIHRLLRDRKGSCSVVFKDGSCGSLSYCQHNRKNLTPENILNENEEIVDCKLYNILDTDYICYVIKKDNTFCLLTCELNVDLNTLIVEKVVRNDIKRPKSVRGTISGITISTEADPPRVHVLWSDGRLCSVALQDFSTTVIGHVPRICPELNVSIAWMGDNNIALYGADSSKERAILIIYNTLFGVLSCSYPLKMFSENARIWCLRDFLILEATHHIAVVPYVLSSKRNAISLIGSHRSENENDSVRIVDWGAGKLKPKSDIACEELASRGYSEREICLQYFPTLFGDENFPEIKKALDSFTDIPEKLIVDIVNKTIENFDLNDSLNDNETLLQKLREKSEQSLILHTLFKLHFSREIMISNLRRDLPFDNALFLLKYFNIALSDTSDLFESDAEFERRIIVWATAVLDAHFQQVILSTEDNVKEITSDLISTIDHLIENLEAIEEFMPTLRSVRDKRDNENELNSSNYYIEEVKLKL